MSNNIPDEILDPVMLASLEGLDLRARKLVDGYLSGHHRSAGRGYSAEFAEHREYTPGDDLRYIDWKIYGRTDKVYLKQSEAETDLVCMLMVDASESMAYQSDPASLSKWEYAQCLAVAFAHLVLRGGDRVSLVTAGNETCRQLPASNRQGMRLQLIHSLEQTHCRGNTSIGDSLQELAGCLRQRSVVIVISDLLDQVERVLAGLKHLSYQRHEVMVLQLLDPAELDFPFERTAQFQGLESLGNLVAQPRGIRQAYLAAMENFLQKIRAGCRNEQVDYLLVRTDQSPVLALKQLLTRRP
ncbi:MAG: DUF58 domain-containing protein [Pirellulales bacterium]